MRLPIIVDTSALISLLSPLDQNNKKAIVISENIRKQKFTLLLPGEVFAETINVFGKRSGHAKTFLIAKELLDKEKYTIIEMRHELRKKAVELFREQPESVSFTDCLVMAFADHFETKDIFGFDDTFRKNGYLRFGIDAAV